MGKDTTIEWTHHTFNPWRGCTKVSDGCKFCYAEKMSHLNPAVLGEWGSQGKRVIAAESYWKQPFSWDRAAKKAGERRRVFCASLADVFEDREDLQDARRDLLQTIHFTPNLDWLLLTKRPGNVLKMVERSIWDVTHPLNKDWSVEEWFSSHPNIWIGASVENQEAANERIPRLLSIPAAVRFLSCEPLLGPLDISHWLGDNHSAMFGGFDLGIRWVIAGGESGPNARPMHPDWVRSLRDQCAKDSIPFFFKQWGEWLPESQDPAALSNKTAETALYVAPDGSTRPARWGARGNSATVQKVGKKKAGRLLGWRTWDETP